MEARTIPTTDRHAGMLLGRLLRSLRDARGYTQAETAELLRRVEGCSQPWLSAVETGRTVPNAGQLEHLLRALGAPEADATRARWLVARGVER